MNQSLSFGGKSVYVWGIAFVNFQLAIFIWKQTIDSFFRILIEFLVSKFSIFNECYIYICIYILHLESMNMFPTHCQKTCNLN